MLQSFIMVLREGFESFLIVAIILSYLRKTGQKKLCSVVYFAVGVSLLASLSLGILLMRGVNHSLWEGVLGVVTIGMVGSLVIHMWRTAPRMRQNIHDRLKQASEKKSTWAAAAGVFLFTLLMMTREGMETALMLLQVREGEVIGGILLGLLVASVLAWMWVRYGQLINLKHFFQVTGVFLILFMVQVAIYSFHEFSESGLFPNSEAIHLATEPFSPVGVYGQWFSLLMVGVSALWLLVSWAKDRLHSSSETLKI